MIKIFSDPCCNFSSERLRELNVDVFSYLLAFKEKEYPVKTDYEAFSAEEYLNSLANSAAPQFSRPPLGDWASLIEPYLSKNFDILYISMSQRATGSGTTISLLSSMFKDKYSSKIDVYDTKCFSWGEAFLLEKACKFRDEGLSITQIKEKLDNLRPSIENWYLPVNARVWGSTNRGDTRNLSDDSSFNLITCDINGIFRPERMFSSRKEGIDFLKLSNAREVWVSFTLDVPQEEKDYLLKQLPESTKISYCSPPFTTATLGPNSIEIAVIR